MITIAVAVAVETAIQNLFCEVMPEVSTSDRDGSRMSVFPGATSGGRRPSFAAVTPSRDGAARTDRDRSQRTPGVGGAMKFKRDMSLWRGTHRTKAKALTDRAYANPSAVCWLCGKTLQQGPRYRDGRPSTWHADHVVPGDPRSPLRLAHSLCNERRGGGSRSRVLDPPSPNG
jgi:hypothetical protein